MTAGKFLRKDWHKISGLGLRRKSKQVWRKPKGRHNKLREKHKSKGLWPSIGYRRESSSRGLVRNLKPARVSNVPELEKLNKSNIAVVSSVGMKKKIEIIKKAMQMGIKTNINEKKFLERAEKNKK